MTDVILYFDWNTFRPDQRQYRQQSIELQPGMETLGVLGACRIAVPVPLEHDFIHNSEEIIQARLGSNVKEPYPVLTLVGMKYVIDKFDLLFKEEEKKEAEVKKDDDDWENDFSTETKPAPAKPAATAEEDWETETKKPDEVPWDESKEEWN